MIEKVPFINYPLQYSNIRKEILEGIDNMLIRWDVYLRNDVDNFEKTIAKYTWTDYGIGVGSCTNALFLSLKALWIKEWDEVITVAHTFIASIDVIITAWATPVLIDIKEDDFTMDPEKLEIAINSKTKAIIPVHLNWHLCEMDKIMKIANKYNIPVIEDAAQALWAKYKWKMAWSFWITWCFSFYPAKVLWTYWDSWMIITKNKEIAEKLYLMRDHWMRPWYIEKPTWEDPKAIHFFGRSSVLDNIHAVILNIKLTKFPKAIERRREIANLYNEWLKNIIEVKVPSNWDENYYDNYQNYVIKAKKRNELKEFLTKNLIETLVKDAIPNHKWPELKLSNISLPITEKISNEIISLPLFPELTNDQIEYVTKKIKEFYWK